MQEMRILLRNQGKDNMTDAKAYMETGGYEGLRKAVGMGGWDIIQTLKDAGLRGRGGAGFPSWMKLKFAFDSESDQKYIVCNADEGEPGTNKDRVLVTADPHSVLEGMAIAGKAVGATKGYIYLRAEYPQIFPILRKSIESAVAAGALGDNIFGSGFNFDITIRSGAGAYICGEETALFESIEGHRGEPRTRPPYPGVHGLFGKPTVLNNVETLANMSHILRNGADWFRSIGTEKSPGTKLFTVIGNVERRGVYEFPMGVNLTDLIFDVCGGVPNGRQLQAVQTGGASGAIINPSQINIPLDIDHVSESGGRLGCGTIFVIDDSNCVLDLVRNNIEFFSHESCGKCIPCREGTRRLYDLVNKICVGNGSVKDVDTIVDLAGTIKVAALCGLGHSSTVPLLSAIDNFPEIWERHIDGENCDKCRIQRTRSVI